MQHTYTGEFAHWLERLICTCVTFFLTPTFLDHLPICKFRWSKTWWHGRLRSNLWRIAVVFSLHGRSQTPVGWQSHQGAVQMEHLNISFCRVILTFSSFFTVPLKLPAPFVESQLRWETRIRWRWRLRFRYNTCHMDMKSTPNPKRGKWSSNHSVLVYFAQLCSFLDGQQSTRTAEPYFFLRFWLLTYPHIGQTYCGWKKSGTTKRMVEPL